MFHHSSYLNFSASPLAAHLTLFKLESIVNHDPTIELHYHHIHSRYLIVCSIKRCDGEREGDRELRGCYNGARRALRMAILIMTYNLHVS